MMKKKKRMVTKFSDLGMKYFPGKFLGLKKRMSESGLGIYFDTYVGRMLMYAFFTLVISFFYLLFTLAILGTPVWIAFLAAIGLSLLSAFTIVGVFYFYPTQIIHSKRRSIEANLPFAANHMGAIAASGIPPHSMFKLLVDAEEYGEIASQAKKIVRNIEVFGMDVSSAIREVAERSPSEEFREFLNGIVSTIMTGGDLKKYLEESAQNALVDYKLKREKYLETLSIYVDIYIGILIVAPLLFVSIFSLMALIGGSFFGLPIALIMALGTYLMIPMLHVIFILFIHLTQPTI